MNFDDLVAPTPVPVWVGGDTTAAFRRVAKYGQGFQAAFQPIKRIREEIAEIRQCCEAINRDPAELTLSVRVYLDPGSVMEESKSISGSRDQMLATIEDMKAIGVSHIVLDPVAPGGISGRLEAVEVFMTDVVD